MLGRPIKLRLSPQQLFIYESEAAYLNQSLNSYLRERLEKADDVTFELQQLRHLLAHQPAQPASATPDDAPARQQDQGILLEILLLLRLLAGPEKMLMVQKELQRLKIPFWTDQSSAGSHGP